MKPMNNAEVTSKFGRAVRNWRGQLGLSQEELAERADLHRTYIADVERGARNLTLKSISKLAKALDVSIAALFTNLKSSDAASYETGSNEFVDILLVEDDSDDIQMTLHAFGKARFANRVHVVRDGVEALEYIFRRGAYANRSKTGRPSVILLDLNLPKITGLEVLQRIKADKKTSKIPVIILTASQSDKDFIECKRLGAENYIVKPVDFQGLSRATPQLNLNWALLKPVEMNARRARV